MLFYLWLTLAAATIFAITTAGARDEFTLAATGQSLRNMAKLIPKPNPTLAIPTRRFSAPNRIPD